MILQLEKDSFFVFDLDDTLYPEIEYLQSAYKEISNTLEPLIGNNIYDEMVKRYDLKENVFEWVSSAYSYLDANISIDNLLKKYREHCPLITLNNGANQFLATLKKKGILSGLITDGRSITQRNKIKALGLAEYFEDIIISEEFGSEKPCEKNYLFFENKYPDKKFYFIGDNTLKDFIVPIKLGWFSICLKSAGRNIHSQNFETLPDLIIHSFTELVLEA